MIRKPEMPGPKRLGSWGGHDLWYYPWEVGSPYQIEHHEQTLRYSRSQELVEALRFRGCPDELLDEISAAASVAENDWSTYRASLAVYRALR